MLAVSALRSAVKDERHPGNTVVTAASSFDECGFPDFSDANALLESIDFDDLFVGMDDGDDVLPGLESMDPELLAGFSVSAGEESSDVNTSSPSSNNNNNTSTNYTNVLKKEDDNDASVKNGSNSSPKESQGNNKSRKSSSSSQSKNSHGKRKVKVDWTPELHRRFVQAVEQLGVDKAVPSRILEIMGIDCLTRHNIASHLQKYRSHRKHLLAREAEAASWSQRRQMYGGGGKRSDMKPWPAMGFPPMAPPPPMHHFRPLHVWGHPSMDPSVMHMWPNKHQPHPGPSWEPPFWRAPTPGTPCFPPPTRFGGPHHVQGIPPHAMYKVDQTGGVGHSGPPPRPLFDSQPSKESIDAAIGDVLSKPWLPLPLGLKPPSTDSVMVELQRQGVPKIPPNTSLHFTDTKTNP